MYMFHNFGEPIFKIMYFWSIFFLVFMFLGMLSSTFIFWSTTYIPSTDSFDEILKSHCKFMGSVGLEMSEDKNLPYLYWTPKLHKVPFKHHFIAASSKCTTKDLSCLLTKVLRYNNTKTSCNGVNSM